MNRYIKILAALLILVPLLAGEPGSEFLILCLVLVSVIYLTGLIRIWRRTGTGHGLSIWRASSFLGAMLILTFTLLGPLDELADKAFSMHMIQHMLLMKVVAPLLLLGQFSTMFLWAVGQGPAHQLGAVWNRSQQPRRIWQQLTEPWAAWVLFASCLWFWHIPLFYQAALENETVHNLEHVSFLGTSLLFWWYLLQSGGNRRVRYGAIILYLFTTLLHESALGALLTFSSESWYAHYALPDSWRLPALADQQLAGVIMWLPGGILFMSLIVGYFGLWLQAIEKQMPIRHTALAQTGESNE